MSSHARQSSGNSTGDEHPNGISRMNLAAERICHGPRVRRSPNNNGGKGGRNPCKRYQRFGSRQKFKALIASVRHHADNLELRIGNTAGNGGKTLEP
jgi:hypothetical protein